MAEKEPIFVVMTVSRQIQGEYVFLRAEGAFRKASQADELVKKLAKEFTDAEGKAKPMKIASPNGETMCWCEVGAFQLELEGEK
jgi:hypothetical protein